MSKRLFQVLDEMNLHDIEHDTAMVTVHPDIISLDHTPKGVVVKVGVPHGVLNIVKESINPTKRIVLIIVDGEEYDKRINAATA